MSTTENNTTETPTFSNDMDAKSSFLAGSLGYYGLLPESTGNKYILLIGNQFAKWYEAVPMPNQRLLRHSLKLGFEDSDAQQTSIATKGQILCQNYIRTFARS